MTGRERILAEDLRLRVVQLLDADPEWTQNADMLRSGLAALGRDVRVDRVVALVEWLAGAGLVTIVNASPPVTVRLTPRGVDLAAGRIVVQGVALSSP